MTLTDLELPRRSKKQDSGQRQPTVSALRKHARKILSAILGDFGFKDAIVENQDVLSGETRLVVTIRYNKDAKGLDGERLLEAHIELQRAFWANGEQRFPYLRHE
jgi:hypothetical protein